jgi:hypothetical protein
MRTKFLLENLKEREHFGDLGIVERIIIQLILQDTVSGCGLDSSGSGQSSGRVLEHGNGTSVSIKGRELLDLLCNC